MNQSKENYLHNLFSAFIALGICYLLGAVNFHSTAGFIVPFFFVIGLIALTINYFKKENKS